MAENQPADNADSTERSTITYRTPEERREAGMGTQLTDWLKLSGLIELEKEIVENDFDNDIHNRVNPEPQVALQLVSEITFSDWLIAELIYDVEYDLETRNRREKRQSGWDEALVEASFDKLGVKFGRLYVPFGEYYSHFVIGPLLEFGETRGDGVIIDYSFTESAELSLFLFDSRIDKVDTNNKLDWGASLEIKSEDEATVFGIGFLSDLAESDEKFLEDESNRYEHRVSAWNSYLLLGFDAYDITAEYILANNEFREFDTNANQPSAWNLEFSFLPMPDLQVAFRYESSDEFSEHPEQRYGISSIWRPGKHLTVAVDYLYGSYKNGFVLDDDNTLKDSDFFAAQIALEF